MMLGSDNDTDNQIRIFIVGDSGVGKTSLVHLILRGSSISRCAQTIGCAVGVKHISYGTIGSSSTSTNGDAQRDFFVELWDISGHEMYKECRSFLYKQINGVIFVHDLSQRRTKTSLHKWAIEISETGTFSGPLSTGGPGGLPIPFLVIGNKVDIAAKEGPQGSSGSLVNAARVWVGKQGLLPSSEELPLTEGFPGSTGLIAAAKEARFDKEAVIKFFRMLIRRTYFSNDLPAPSPWSLSLQQNPVHSIPSSIEDDKLHNKLSLAGERYNFNALPPFQAQHLTPSPILDPQQSMTVQEKYNFPEHPNDWIA